MFFSLSMFLLVASVLFGIAVVINRLRDFRATMNAARGREQGLAESVVEKYRELYCKLGRRTWVLFWFQLGTFGAGIVLTIISILWVAAQKLL